MEQLKYWREKGYHVSLDTIAEGKWALVVGSDPVHDWAMRGGYDMGMARQVVRFVSLPYDTPEECIKAAMEVLR